MGAPALAMMCRTLVRSRPRRWLGSHGRPDINSLALACGPDQKLKEHGWTTRKRKDGTTEWIPPPHLDHGQPITNSYHHPEELLCEDEDDL